MVEKPQLDDFDLAAQLAEVTKERDRLAVRLYQETGARADLTEAQKRIAKLEQQLDLFAALDELSVTPPKWTMPTGRKQGKATAHLLLSDLHLDEHVDPAHLGGVNAYSRDIATLRMRRLAGKLVSLSRMLDVKWSGISVDLAGDVFSGNIHDELRETNEDTLLGSLDYWVDHLAALLDAAADEFGRVWVKVVVGNHGRNTRKPRHKLRARDNYDWFIGRMLARHFRGDQRIQWTIGESPDQYYEVHGHRYLLTHGDAFRGGGGIAGVWSPVERGRARTLQRDVELDRPFDTIVMGHWHQITMKPNLLVNGALKGYDEYAYDERFLPEPASQLFWMTTPEHGPSMFIPIHVADRAKEGW